jgi:fluoroquinolone transport system permease protein
MILDDRDERILSYLAVTPLSKTGYLFYRLLSPVILSFFCALVGLWIIHLVPLNLGRMIPVFMLSALEAPMMGLFLGTFAANKVEGMALSKGLGVLFFAPIVGYFVKSPWQMIAGIFPPYWVSKAFIAVYEPDGLYWLYIAVGLVVHLLVIYLLLVRFQKKAD